MARSLGVFVTSNRHLDKIIELCKVAKKKQVEVTVFFSHLGTTLTQDRKFGELEGLANMSLCNVAFEGHGLKPPVPGITENGYATQVRHAEMIQECDRYLVF